MPDSRARIWFSLFVLAVFCLGGAGGFFLGRHVSPGPFFAAGPPPGSGPDGLGFGGPGAPGMRRGGPGRGGLFGRGGPPPLPPDVVDRLASDLKLDAAQQDQVRKIVDDRRARLEAVHREARERFDKEQTDLHAAIRAVLRPDQQAEFDKFVSRRP
ncbi:MAG TPA: hypothetical protein VF921_06570 [Vicinamibacterales bacterium]